MVLSCGRRGLRLAVLAVLFGAVFALGPWALVGAQDSVAVSLRLSSPTVEFEGTFDVEVTVGEGARDLYGAQFSLSFDPEMLQVQDANEIIPGVQVEAGPLLAADLADTPGSDFLVARNGVDNSLGRVDFIITQTHPAPPVSEGGILARVTFLAINPGQSDVSLADVILSNIEGEAILTSPSGATVTISPPIAVTPPSTTERSGPSPTGVPTTVTVPAAATEPSPTPPAGPAATPTSTAQPTKTARQSPRLMHRLQTPAAQPCGFGS